MKFLKAKRDSTEGRTYFPGPGYYFTFPNNPKYNDFYKSSFFQNLGNTDNNVENFGTAKRFNYNVSYKTPGPGQYGPQPQQNQSRKKKRNIKNEGIHDKMRTVPSITQSNQFYEEMEDKNFLVKKGSEDNKKVSIEDVGPGFYDPGYSLVKPKIYQAKIPQEIMKKPKEEQGNSLELFLSSSNMRNRPKSWQRTSTRNKNDDNNEDDSIQNTFIHPEKAKKPKKPIKFTDDRSKSLFQHHQYPLTDFYCEPEKVTAFKPIKKPKKLQCFESNVKRFGEEKDEKPGPGDYNPEKYYDQHHKVAFYKSTMPRFKEKKTANSETPSIASTAMLPNENKSQNESVNFCKCPAIFGAGTKRFIENKRIAPGPGDYNLNQTDIKSKKKKTKIIIMDIGKESSLRSQQTSEIERIDPRLLFEGEEYEIKKKDINEELNRFYGGKNTSSFASKVGRFHDDEEKKIENQNIGPGSYGHHKKGLIKPSFNTNKETLFDQSEKQGLFAKKAFNSKLGPGSYDYDFTRIKTKRFINVKL